MTRILSTALTVALVATTLGNSQGPAHSLPPRLESYLTKEVKLSAGERTRLAGGAPVTKLLDVHDSKEVAVFGAVWIDAAMGRYVEALKDIEKFERGGGFKVTRRISAPPRLEDFAGLKLPREDVEDLRTCRVGSCEVKLGKQALDRFRTEIDWTAPGARDAADALMRQLAFEYATEYLDGGNERLAVYRDSSRPTFVEEEFRSMLDQMPELTVFVPDMRRYLSEYPRVTLPGSTSILYWQETEFGLKPTIRINHLTIRERPDDTVAISKMLYASHYFWTGLELRVLLPDPSRRQGFWFVTVSRSRSDGLTGLKGLFIRPRVRSDVLIGTLTALKLTKQMLEASR